MANHQRLRLQWIHEHKAWQADWHRVVFPDESRFNLWDYDDRIRVRRYAGQRCFPECVIEQHSGRTPGVMIWGAISYLGRSNLLRIESNLNGNRYIHEVLQPEVFFLPSIQGILGTMLQWDNFRPHVSKTVQPNTWNFFLSLIIHRIYKLLSTCGIWLVSVSLVIRDLQLQKMQFDRTYKKYGIILQNQTFKICLTQCHVV